jgi:hypothetical protein
MMPNKIFLYSFWGIVWLGNFLYVYFYSSAAPMMDDYDFYLGSLIQFNKTQEFYPKLLTLFSQHNEHRPFIPRCIGLLMVKLGEGVNFKTLILLGNLALLTLWIVLKKNIPVKNQWMAFIISVAIFFILIGVQSAENSFWATGALQNYSTILFCTLCIYFSYKGKTFISVLFALCAILCSMTGFLLFPFLLFFLFKDKKWVSMIIVLLCILVVSVLYFANYKTPLHSIIFANSVHDNLNTKFKYFFVFIGSCFSWKNNSGITFSFWAGVVLLILFVVQNINYKKWDFWTYLGLFVILNALAASNSRSIMGLEQGLSERYRIISELFLIVCSLKTLKSFPNRNFITGYVFLIFSLFSFTVQIFYRQTHIVEQKKLLDTGLALFVIKMDPALLVYPIPALAGVTLLEAHERKIYKPTL